MTKNLGRISQLKIAIDTLTPFASALKTIEDEIQTPQSEKVAAELLSMVAKAKTQLEKLKKE